MTNLKHSPLPWTLAEMRDDTGMMTHAAIMDVNDAIVCCKPYDGITASNVIDDNMELIVDLVNAYHKDRA